MRVMPTTVTSAASGHWLLSSMQTLSIRQLVASPLPEERRSVRWLTATVAGWLTNRLNRAEYGHFVTRGSLTMTHDKHLGPLAWSGGVWLPMTTGQLAYVVDTLLTSYAF